MFKRSRNSRAFILGILLFSIILNIFNINKVEATYLNGVDLDVYLMDNGDARVTTIWRYNDDQGTEHFVPININEIDIKDLQVSRNGEEYEILPMDEWDVGGSKEDKAGKAGIIDNGDSYEICWGITEYGNNDFKVSYTVEGMVKNLEDAQMLYYKFINDSLSEPPEVVNMTIHSDKIFTEEDVRMWGFGFNGEIHLVDGKIELTSLQPLSSNNFVEVLLRFDLGYFNSQYDYDDNFERLRSEAFEGSDYTDYEDSQVLEPGGSWDDSGDIWVGEDEGTSSATGIFMGIIGMLFFPIMIILIILGVNASTEKVELGIKVSDYKEEYYRDLPFKGPLDHLYFLLHKLGLTDYDDVINYYFLKWMRDGVIVKESYESGIFFKKEKDGLRISKDPVTETELEKDFFKFLKEAAGANNLLEEKEFNKWMEKYSSRFETFTEELDVHSRQKLMDLGYIELEERKQFIGKRDYLVLTDSGRELAENLIKFKNYLYDFSLLNERDSINIHLWDDLMLYAGMFGITERVQKEFSKLSPKYFEQTNYDIRTIYLCNLYSRSITQSYASVSSASSFSSSGGFGGGTSFGGGGGGFGGGSGGGTR